MTNLNSRPDRDPTPGELFIMFSQIVDTLKDMRETMATKEFVNAKFDSYNDRVRRLEDDVKAWISTSTEAHVTLAADSKARHEQAETDSIARNVQVNGRIDKIEKDQKEQETTIKAQRNGRAQAITISIIGAVLAVFGSVFAQAITRTLFP